MIHHVSVGSNDIEKSRKFYDPLGLRVLAATGRAADYGVGEVMFSIETPVNGKPATAGNGVHIALQARDREMVRQFYALALENGGKSAGEPGIRPEYDENYYGAFVFDPDGNKIEAVTFSAK